MNNFIFHNPTKIIFGKDQLHNLASEIKAVSSRVLLVYGKESIKRSGLYDKIITILNEAEISIIELSAVSANPKLLEVRKGIALCREHQLNFILAIGGGSVIDCAKAITVGVPYQGDVWDFWQRKAEPQEALPLGTIVTLAATGSEMNDTAVISEPEENIKSGYAHFLMRPSFSFLDPSLTYSVNSWHTAAGCADIFCHLVEFYFDKNDHAFLQNRLIEAIMKTVIHYGPIALTSPDNYEARSNLMWASTMALNGITRESKDFEGFNHLTEHAINGFYDKTHGAVLAVLMPHWMKFVLSEDNKEKFYQFAVNVWDIKTGSDTKVIAQKGIAAFSNWLQQLQLPSSFSEMNITLNNLEQISENALVGNETLGIMKALTKDEIITILKNAQ